MSDVRDRLEQLTPLQRATLGLRELRARLDALEAARREPIAIIGMACRFPGGAHTPEALWRLVRNNTDAITEVPGDRWDHADFHDPDPDAPGKHYTARSGFFTDHPIDAFDAGFFNLSPIEASGLDPQQRLLLELAWETLEDAGLAADRLVGTRTGVYVGLATGDYGLIAGQHGVERVDPYVGLGTSLSTAAGRLAFVLGLRGPTLALDTACSSSLVALHLACQALRLGECDLALAGGANLILAPVVHVFYSRMRALAPDGRCKAFDAAADGMVRGEGGALLALKRLADAHRDGDRVLALVRGSAVNHDGRSSGLTVPNGTAQREVLRAAFASAGVAPTRARYVETHGTGTALGDPIEANALIAELGPGRTPDAPLYLGSIKSNIGHLEAAAGVAGLVKTVMALRHREIPPQLHFQALNPQIDPGEVPLIVPTTNLPWPDDSPRIAGVSAFGMSGTNAHVVLAEAPPDPSTRTTDTPDPSTRTTPPDPLTRTTNPPDPSTTPPDPLTRTTAPDPLTRDALLLPLSARSPEALRALAMAYHQRLAERPDLDPADLCRAAAVRRARLELRLAVTGATRDDLQDALSAFLQRELHPRCFASPARPGPAPRVTFVFSGHSGHWVGMGRELLARAPAFRAAFEACAAALQEHAPIALVDHLLAADAETRWTRPEVLQPLVFAVQVALAALWRAWGVEPAAVVGHSAGEIAAAHVAGALSLADAARLCARRSELIGRAHGTGAMAVIALPLDRVRTALAGHEHQLGVAACNSPSSTVISGDPHALDLVLAQLARQNVFARVVRGATAAGHSPQMDAITPALTAALAGLSPRPATVPFYSTVTATLADGASLGPTYWAQNLRAPVLFAQTIAELGHDGHDTFVEIGPHPLLLGAIEQTLRPRGGAITLAPSTRSGEPERLTMLTSLARLFAAGLPLDWTHLHPSPGPVLPLPTYPWQRQRHWIPQPRFTPAVDHSPTTTTTTTTPAPARTGPFDHHLASARNPGEHTFERTLPGPAGLALQDTELLPAALCTRLALAAGAAVGLTAPALAHVTLTTLELVGATTLQLSVSPDHTLEIHARTPAGWTRIARGHLRQGPPAPAPTPTDLTTLRARCPITQDGPTWYATLTDRGLAHAPTLRPIANLWRSDTEALAALTPDNLTTPITTPTAESAAPITTPPDITTALPDDTLVEAMSQTLAALAFPADAPPVAGEVLLPAGFTHLELGPDAATARWCHAVAHAPPTATGGLTGDVHLLDAAGRRVGALLGLQLAPPPRALARRTLAARWSTWRYTFAWEPAAPATARPTTAGSWLVLADPDHLGPALVARLLARGDHARLVVPGRDFAAPEHGPWQLDPDAPAHFDRLLAEARRDGPLRGVLHLASLAATPTAHTTLDSLAAAETLGPVAALHLTQALVRARSPARLWLVTRGAQPVAAEGPALAIAQAPLWGLGKTLAVEHSEHWGRLVDLDPAAPPDEPDALLAELDASDDEDFVALRHGQRHVARLIRLTAPDLPAAPLSLAADRSYLVTGGLGGVGLQIASWLVDRGARHLVVLGRRALPPRATWDALPPGSEAWTRVAAVRALEARGAAVDDVAADVADLDQLAAVLASLRARGRRLAGVVHAAGVSAPALLVDTTAADMRALARPKLAGTWNLATLTRDDHLDFFACFSSAAAVWGASGLGPYAAANHFLDAAVHVLRARGVPALAVNWGGFAGGGMATAEVQRAAASMGLGMVPAPQMLEALDAFIQTGATQVTLGPIDWRIFKPLFEVRRRRPMMARIEVTPDPTDAPSGFARELAACDPRERSALLAAHVRGLAARVLGLADPAALDPHQGFFQMGMDSVMSVRLRNQLELALAATLPPTLAFEHPSVAALTAYLAREVLGLAPPPEPAPAADPDLDDLDEDQLAALLAAELDHGGAA